MINARDTKLEDSLKAAGVLNVDTVLADTGGLDLTTGYHVTAQGEVVSTLDAVTQGRIGPGPTSQQLGVIAGVMADHQKEPTSRQLLRALARREQRLPTTLQEDRWLIEATTFS